MQPVPPRQPRPSRRSSGLRQWIHLVVAACLLLATVGWAQIAAPPRAEAVIDFDCESSEGLAYFVNTNGQSVSLVYTGTDTNIRNIPVGGVPYGVGATPDGSKVYVAGGGAGGAGVVVIDTDSFAVTPVPALAGFPWAGPVGAWPSTDGTKMFVTNIRSNRVSVIDTATDTMVASISLGAQGDQPGYLDAIGDRLFVANSTAGGRGGFSEVDMATNTLVRTVSDPTGAHAIAVNPTLLATSNQDQVIRVRATAAPSAVARTITVPTSLGFVHGMAFVPGTNYLVATTNVTAGSAHTLVYDASTGALLRDFTAGGPFMRTPVTSPLSPEVFIAGGTESTGTMDRMVTSGPPSGWTYTPNQTALQAFPDGHTPAFSCLRALGGTKSLADTTVKIGETTTLTITLENYNVEPSSGATGAAVEDELPDSLEIAATPNATTSCAGGTVSADPGGGSVSLTGGVVPAATFSGNTKIPGRCTVEVDVVAVGPAGAGSNVIPTGAITGDGLPPSTTEVRQDFRVYAAPTVQAQKNLPDGRAQAGDQFTTTIAVDGAAVATGTTGGAETGLQDQTAAEVAGPYETTEDITFTVTESAAGTTDLADYVASYTCVDTRNDDAPVASGTGTTATFTLPAQDADVAVVCTFTNVIAEPDISLTKTAGEVQDLDDNGADAGDVVTYSFVVENTGNVALDPITVSDPLLGGTLACGTGPLAAGQSRTCPSVDHTLTQAEADAGLVENTATVSGTAPNGDVVTDDDDADIDITAAPAVTLTKTVAPGSVTTAGTQVTFSYLITNTGNVTLTDATVTESDFSGSGTLGALSCPTAAESLAPGQSVTCTRSYTITQADVDAGGVTNTATATGTPPGTTTAPTSDPDDAEVTVERTPSVSLVKSATAVVDLDDNGPDAGDRVGYTFLITNTGNVTLSDVTPIEGDFSGTGDLGPVVCPAGADSLAPNAQVTCTASYTLTQADVDAGEVTNSATATGTPPDGLTAPVSPADDAEVELDPAPALTIVKSADPSTPDDFVVDQEITYTFLVTNTGNVTLDDVTVDETDFTGSGTAPEAECPAGAASLAPGQQVACTATYTVTQADVDNGGIDNTAVATGTPPAGPEVSSDPDSIATPSDPEPELSLEKSVSPTVGVGAGGQVTYSFLITNTGNTTITDVDVDEGSFSGTEPLGAITCPTGAESMIPGARVTCTAEYTISQADVDAGTITNDATATGTALGSDTVVSQPDDAELDLPGEPSISLAKTVTPGTVTAAGAEVTFSYLITNTGDVTLRSASVNETAFTGTGELGELTCPVAAAELGPDAEVTCTRTYTLTQDDVDAGGVTNTATATALPPDPTDPLVVSTPDDAEVTATAAPALTIVKSVDAAGVTAAGDEVTYSFLITNTGNVTLFGVAVDETAFSGTGTAPSVVCPAGSGALAPDAVVTCTSTYVLTQADVDAGTVSNTAAAVGTPPGTTTPIRSTPDQADVDIDPAPGLTLVKSATPTDPESYVVGQQISYAFLVTNTGNVTLSTVTIAETDFTGSGPAPQPVCPTDAADALAPGAQVTCTATYTLTQADVDAQELSNTATAAGIPPGAVTPVTSAPSSVALPGDAAPAITLTKSGTVTPASRQESARVGDTIAWTFVVTNTGNVTLDQVSVTDPTAGPVTCEATSLAPGSSTACAADVPYTVTQSDVDGGTVTNTASVSAAPRLGGPVSAEAAARVPTVEAAPSLGLQKQAAPEDENDDLQIEPGESIRFSFDVTNLGNVTLTDVMIRDSKLDDRITCPDVSLAPGASLTCTAVDPYRVTDADGRSGVVRNVATAAAGLVDGASGTIGSPESAIEITVREPGPSPTDPPTTAPPSESPSPTPSTPVDPAPTPPGDGESTSPGEGGAGGDDRGSLSDTGGPSPALGLLGLLSVLLGVALLGRAIADRQVAGGSMAAPSASRRAGRRR